MAKIVAIINQKGGVGKSTTASALASGLLLKKKKTLVIDMDAQGNLTFTYNADKTKASVLDVLTGEVSAKDAIQKTPNGDIIPANNALAGADAFIDKTGKEYRLKESLEAISNEYDYIVIDTPPALGILTINALTACNTVVIPAQADIYSLQGIEQLAETMKPVKKYCNPNLSLKGIVLTRFNNRSILSRDVAELAADLAKKLNTKLFKTTIRDAIAIKEAQISQQNIFSYAPTSNVAEDYREFVKEFLKDE